MKNTCVIPKKILICALVSVAAVALTIVSDLIMLGKPAAAYSFIKLGPETMANISQWRVTFGTMLGVFVLPLQLPGLILIYYGLKTAGRLKALLMVLPVAHALIMADSFHISYAFMASGWKLSHSLNSHNLMALDMLSKFNLYWKITLIIMGIDVMFSSIVYVKTIMTKKTLFQSYNAFLNPISIVVILFLLIIFIPAPVGGFIAPTFLNLSTFTFYIISLFSIKKKEAHF